jgi:short-subunit dehydrogenase
MHNPMSLENQTIIVTGAAQGIGEGSQNSSSASAAG